MAYVHPGTVLTQNQMQYAYAQAMANREPWKSSFENFQSRYSTFLDGSYTSHSHTMVGRNLYKADYENDSMAVFVNGVMWNMTGEIRYAEKALELLESWSAICTTIQYPDNDWQLSLGYGLHFMVYGADMIYHFDGFTADKKHNVTKLFTTFRNYIVEGGLAVSTQFPYVKYGWPSWGSGLGKFLMAYAIFTDDTQSFAEAKSYFFRAANNDADNGTVITAFLNSGQGVEMARDNYYAQLSLASFLESSQMAFNQGDSSLFDARDGVIGKAMEYLGKYNIGGDVNWEIITPAIPIWQRQDLTAIAARSNYRPIWYLGYNYYHHYRGIAMPYTAHVIEQNKIEGTTATITDQVGWGSLFFNNAE